jgi:hypothetical protein
LIAIASCVRCPEEIRTENRKNANKNLWKRKEWINARKRFIDQNPTCIYCGRPATVPHHPTRQDYGTDAYIENISDCEPVCRACHLGIEKGYHLCDKCKQHFTKFEACSYCYDGRNRHKEQKRLASSARNDLIKKEVISLISWNLNGIYCYVDEMIRHVDEEPTKYPLLAKFNPVGRHYKIAKILLDLGLEKTRRNHRCKTWVLRSLAVLK